MAQVDDLQQQLGYFQAWASSLATAAPQPQALDAAAVLSTLQLLVTGLPPGTSEGALEAWLNDLASTHAAAVAPGPAVSSVQLQRQAAVVQLRCALEASNCLAFDGVQMNGATLQVTRPRDYCPATALLLGPCQPNPAVVASVRRAWHAKPAASASDHDHPSFAAVAASKAATAAGGHSSCSFAAAVRSSHPVHAPMTCRVAADGSCSAGSADPCGSAACKTPTAARDLLMAPDQSKQDEVFIGGLPSHWKAQQVKELLAPYGQLKSLSVAMDAATGKNKGYAFVVFASSASLAQAIEELDCRVVEGGKILAVQRATDGKAAGSSARESMTGSDTGALRDGGGSSSGQQLPLLQQQPHLLQQQRPAQRMSSGGLAQAAAPAAAGVPAAAAEACHTVAAGPAAGSISQQAAVALAAAGGDDGTTLGQRLLAAVVGGGGGGGGGSGGHGLKQYDVNELYIGDLPLSWDEDAVRRLLGRYGKIKYFTLRNGRDKNFAFVKYKDAAVVEPAIAGLHGKIVDGYFLNVRRAIEGKQQHQQQQQWAGAKQQQQHQPQGQQQGQQQQLGRGGLYEARGSFDAGSRAARLRLSLDQQLHCQQQKQGQQQLGAPMLHKGAPPPKGPPPPPAAAAPPAGFARSLPGLPGPGAAAASSQPQQAAAAHSNAELLRAGQLAAAAPAAAAAAPPAALGAAGVAPEAGVAAAAAAAARRVAGPGDGLGPEPAGVSVQPGAGTATAEPQQQQQQQPALTPVAGPARAGGGSAPGELQAELPQTFVAAAPPAQGPGYRHPLQQQQQQQQPGLLPVVQPPFQAAQPPQQSLFTHHGPSASWGAPGEAAGSSNGNGNGSSNGRGCQGQPPRQSLLQTWDMLSPWSLFSHTAQ